MAFAVALPAQAAQGAQREESLAEKAARARKASAAAAAAAPAGSAKVLTNEDLANAKGNVIILSAPPASEAQPAATAAATEAAPAGAPEKPKQTEPTEEEKRAQAGTALQKQIDEQAESIRKARKTIEAGETELNDITNYTFGARRAAVMQSIEEARQAVAAAQRSIEDLEVQARRQGIRVTLP